MSNTRLAKQDDDTELKTCLQLLSLFKDIANEKCRVIPTGWGQGSGSQRMMLHHFAKNCQTASEDVIAQAESCHRLSQVKK